MGSESFLCEKKILYILLRETLSVVGRNPQWPDATLSDATLTHPSQNLSTTI